MTHALPEENRDPIDQHKLTLYEQEFDRAGQPQEPVVSLIIFRLASEWYGVRIECAREVVSVASIAYLPSCPEYIRGIVNLRGTILPVTDFKRIFGLPEEPLTEKSKLLVIATETMQTGLLVDEVFEVIDVFVRDIDPVISTLPPDYADFLEGECTIDDKLVGILKVGAVFQKTALK